MPKTDPARPIAAQAAAAPETATADDATALQEALAELDQYLDRNEVPRDPALTQYLSCKELQEASQVLGHALGLNDRRSYTRQGQETIRELLPMPALLIHPF